MQEILKTLNKDPGIKGSMIVTEDGLVVVEELGPTLEKETISALSANIIITSQKVFKDAGWEAFTRYVLTATYGRIVFYNLNGPFLVVITDMDIKLDQTLLEIASAARKIQQKRELRD